MEVEFCTTLSVAPRNIKTEIMSGQTENSLKFIGGCLRIKMGLMTNAPLHTMAMGVELGSTKPLGLISHPKSPTRTILLSIQPTIIMITVAD